MQSSYVAAGFLQMKAALEREEAAMSPEAFGQCKGPIRPELEDTGTTATESLTCHNVNYKQST